MKRFNRFAAIAMVIYIMTALPVNFIGDNHILKPLLKEYQSANLFADESKDTKTEVEEKSAVTNDNNVLLKVMAVILIVWLGIALFLFRLDRRISRIEKELKSIQD